jgi:broad specificity phosphatase PhoE
MRRLAPYLVMIICSTMMLVGCCPPPDSGGFQGKLYESWPDPTIGPPIPGAEISFVSEDGSITKSTTSTSSGSYRLDLEEGRYLVTANHLAYYEYSSAPDYFAVSGYEYKTRDIFMHRKAATIILLVRHAEKASTSDPNTNLDPDLNNEGIGVTRAEALAEIAANGGVAAVYTTKYCRTAQTSQPSAAELNLPLHVQPTNDSHAGLDNCDPEINVPLQPLPGHNTPEQLAQEVLTQQSGNVVLIVGHRDTVPKLAVALGTESLCPTFLPGNSNSCNIPGDQYDNLFIVTVPDDGSPVEVTHRKYGAQP